MALIALIIGVVLVVAAIRNTHGQLFTALGQDLPAFAVMAAAIFAIGVVGFVPGLKGPSRMLLALVFVVIVLMNYRQILGGFQSAWQGASGGAGAASAGSGTSGSQNPLAPILKLLGGSAIGGGG